MRIFLTICLFYHVILFSQEIEHKHSIHHAFIENKGQWHKDILFKSQFQGGNLWVQQHKMLFHLTDFSKFQKSHANFSEKIEDSQAYSQDAIHLNFLGSNQVKSIQKENAIDAYYNFFIGNDKSKWQGNVSAYYEATLNNLYDGIDLKLIEEKEQLKYEFHVQNHVNPNLINLEYVGQQRIQINKKGNLIIETKNGIIQENKPYSYQIINGKIVEVECEFSLKNNKTSTGSAFVSFELGNYNPDFKLIIDPVLVFATYCGSITDNFGMTATYGYDETAYSAGTVYGNLYPTPDDLAYDVNSNFTIPHVGNSVTTDVFVSKYSADGTTMLWTTFLGGGNDTTGTETAHSLICDLQNNVYVYGATASLDFPIQGGFQQNHEGGTPLFVYSNGSNFLDNGTDIYVAKISANGHNLLASTYIGGSDNDGVNYNIYGKDLSYQIPNPNPNNINPYDSLTSNYGDQFRGEIMLDSLNNVLIGSCSRSVDFPTLNPIQNSNTGQQDGVIFKLNSDLSALIFSTYLGGSNNDAIYSIKIDSSYNMVFAGGTSSNDLPQTSGAWKSSYNGGKSDGFVGKLNPTGTNLQRISYLGEAEYDQAFFVEIDRNDNVFLLGQSIGGNFDVFNSNYVDSNSGQFICKLSPDLTTLQNSTVFGNGDKTFNISPSAFLVDICGNIYVSGWGANILQGTPLNGMPFTSDAEDSIPPNGFDFYLFVLERNFSGLKYATYLGGNVSQEHVDGGTSRFDKNGVVYQSVCGGCGKFGTGMDDFETTPNAWSNLNLSSNCNNLIFKFDFELVLNSEFTASQEFGCSPLSVTFQNNTVASDTYFWVFGNGDTSSLIFSPTIIFDSAGIYEVYLVSKDSVCLLVDTAKTTISVGLPFNNTMSNDTLMCESNFIDLTAFPFGDADHFIWSSNRDFTDTLNTNFADSTVSVFPENQTQTYYAKMSNFGCSKIDSVVVNLTSAGLILSGTGLVCQDEDFIATATNNSPLSYTYSWYPSSLIKTQLSTTSVSAITTKADYLFVDVQTNTGCNFTDSILINVSQVYSAFVDAFSLDTLILEGTQTTLFANPVGTNYSYSWTPTTGLSAPNSQSTLATVSDTTTFKVTVTEGNCVFEDSVTIYCFNDKCEPPNIYIPNAFSPNEKGKNEIFYVRGPQITKMLFRIFNRWGEMVFESTDPLIGWDGTFKGRKLDPDVFDYYVEVTCLAGNTEIIKGNVTLLK
ncbi:MAG: gliding motility-associated C-terminal domain-containing protein [Bacteroidota bacterium]